MNWITIVGSGAALCSMVSFVPQAWRIIRTRDTAAISAATYSVTICGFALWVVYGFLLGEWPIIITNSVCFVLAGFILTMKLLPRRKREAVAEALDISSQD